MSARLLPLLLGILQSAPPQLAVSVDGDRLSVGEELVYTVRAASHSPLPMQVSVASPIGLEIVSRTERTELGTDVRTTVLEIRARAVRPGRWEIGPARAVQGRDTVEAAAVVISVSATRSAAASALSRRLHRLLERSRPPPPGQAGIDLLVSADTARVGEQVDVVTLAWFPRDLRLQLRRPPTLQPPVIDGVWAYAQATPAGIAATRSIRGRWYDLFVAHQVVFPLLPGTIAIPRATLKYSTPVALQFFSQEERFALTSRAETLVVHPIPEQGRPADFAGAIGSGVHLERRITPPTAILGEGVAVEFSLTGEGNTSLWPAPEIGWPASVRAYVERVGEQVGTTDGRVTGSKTFRYLVVPDSAGVLTLPMVSYSYFDLQADRYLTIGSPAAALPVGARGELAASAALPPPLLVDQEPSLGWRIGHGAPDWVWIAILASPPLLVLLWRRWPASTRQHRAPPRQSDLEEAEDELNQLVWTLVPDPDRRFGDALAAALRAAGATTELAARVAVVRERLLARRYGPDPSGDDQTLARDLRDVVHRLGGSLRGWRGAATIVLAALFFGTALPAQAPAPEQLYQQGALRAAAAVFSHRAAAEPGVTAHWYNLGATYYRLGLKGRAAAAWIQARRLSPRTGVVRRALELTPAPDVTTGRWTWTPPLTPEELLIVASIGWLLGWVGWSVRPRIRDRWLLLLAVSGAALLAGLGLRATYRRPIGIMVDSTPLRLSPNGRTPVLGTLEGGGAVRIVRVGAGWLLVQAPGARTGWVPAEAVASIGG